MMSVSKESDGALLANAINDSSSSKSSQKESLETESVRISAVDEIPRLSTWFNCTIIFFFAMFYSAASTSASLAGLLVYSSKYKMNPLFQSIVGYIITIEGVYLNVLVGYFGDRIMTRWGRRKPFVLVGWCIQFVGFCMLALPPFAPYDVGASASPSMSPTTIPTKAHSPTFMPTLMPSPAPTHGQGSTSDLDAYYFVANIIVMLGLSIYGEPLYSWFVESSADSNDFLRLFTVPINFGGAIGGIIGLATVAFLDTSLYGFLLGLIGGGPCLALFLYYVPNRVVKKVEKQPPILASVRSLVRTNEFQIVFGNRVLLNTAMGIGSEFLGMGAYILFSYQLKHWQELQKYAIILIIANVVCISITLGFLNPLVGKYEKIKVYQTLALIAMFLGVFEMCVYIPGFLSTYDSVDVSHSTATSMFGLYMAWGVLMAVVFSCIVLIQGLFERDIIRLDTFITSINRENMYQTALNVPSSLITTFLVAIPMAIFYSSGWKAYKNVPIGDDLIAHRFYWTDASYFECAFFPTFIFIFVAFLSYRQFTNYPLTQQVADKIQNALLKREAPVEAFSIDNNNNNNNGRSASEKLRASKLRDTIPAAAEAEEEEEGVARADSVLEVVSMCDNEDEMLMLHFSQLEVRAMAKSPCSNPQGTNEALSSISFYHRLGLFFFGPLVMSCLLAGFVVQMSSLSNYAILSTNLFCICSAYVFYEALRFLPVQTLCKLSGKEVAEKAIAAEQRNNKKRETLQQIIARDGIDHPEFLQEGANLETEGGDAESEMSTKMTGYKRIFAVLTACAVLGVLFATVIV